MLKELLSCKNCREQLLDRSFHCTFNEAHGDDEECYITHTHTQDDKPSEDVIKNKCDRVCYFIFIYQDSFSLRDVIRTSAAFKETFFHVSCDRKPNITEVHLTHLHSKGKGLISDFYIWCLTPPDTLFLFGSQLYTKCLTSSSRCCPHPTAVTVYNFLSSL